MCHELPHTAPCNASHREEDGRQVGDDEGDDGDDVKLMMFPFRIVLVITFVRFPILCFDDVIVH